MYWEFHTSVGQKDSPNLKARILVAWLLPTINVTLGQSSHQSHPSCLTGYGSKQAQSFQKEGLLHKERYWKVKYPRDS